MSAFDLTSYQIKCEKLKKDVRIAVLADLHSSKRCDVDTIVAQVRLAAPDIAMFPGDTFELLDGSHAECKQKGFELISRISEICPAYLSVGNHENGGVHSWNLIKWSNSKAFTHCFDKDEIARIEKLGGVFLDNSFAELDGIRIGGLSSGIINERRQPCLDWIEQLCDFEGVKILMCHHPEYFVKYLNDKDIDLVVSGHAHGGQWRIFGKGVFAPGQGIFPKYTQGVHFGKLVISRGLKRAGVIPRFFNKPEIVIVDLTTQ